MRVPNNSVYVSYLRDLQRTQEQMFDAQMQVTSGRKVLKPSDNPVAASDIIRLSGEKAEAEQFVRNLEAARSRLSSADSILDSVERMMERVHTLAQSSLGNLSQPDAFATELEGLRDQLLAAANTTHAGRYIFGGSVTSSMPFVKATSGAVTYQGNSTPVMLQVGRNTTVQAQVPGDEIFTGTADIFAILTDLITAVRAGDTVGVDAQLQPLLQVSAQISTARTRVGGYMNLADSVSGQLTEAGLVRAQELNEVLAADPAQAITQLTLSQTNLQATLAVGARIAQMSLLDYLT